MSVHIHCEGSTRFYWVLLSVFVVSAVVLQEIRLEPVEEEVLESKSVSLD